MATPRDCSSALALLDLLLLGCDGPELPESNSVHSSPLVRRPLAGGVLGVSGDAPMPGRRPGLLASRAGLSKRH
ncbi:MULTISPECIES: hypothetical protein [Pseudomonas]|uniref:hypothetical protein n=1 Tax=Pseudomonadaceae TaxID=135621 RepID=UPI001112E948|nr:MULTISPECIES: hypothetical protein [Pseudomonas]